MSVAIFSDLHLAPEENAEHRRFVDELKKLRSGGTRELWLLGDIFDLLVGSHAEWEERYPLVFGELKAWLQAGRKILWFEGNHDFLLAPWLRSLGIELYTGPAHIERGGQLYFVAHGDEVNDADQAYLRWRKTMRSLPMRIAVASLPGPAATKVIHSIGGYLSRASRTRQPERQARWPENDLRRLYQDYARARWHEGARGVLLGHCHVRDLVEHDGYFYLNAGSWLGNERPYAFWQEAGKGYPEWRFCSTIEV